MAGTYRTAISTRAGKDIEDICSHIANRLHNPDAARVHKKEFNKTVNSLRVIPQRNSPLYLKKKQSHFRRQLVKNYYLYYFIEETARTVIIVTVQYCRRDLKNIDFD